MTNSEIDFFYNKRGFRITWNISINDQSLGEKRRLSKKSKNIVKKIGFYKKGNKRMDKLKMRIKKGIIKKLYLIIISLHLRCLQ